MLLACSLVSAPYRWLIGAHVPTPTPAPAATPTPTPAQLEEGIVAPEDASPAALTTSSASATCGTLFLLVVSAAFIAWDLLFRVRARVLAPAHSALCCYTSCAGGRSCSLSPCFRWRWGGYGRTADPDPARGQCASQTRTVGHLLRCSSTAHKERRSSRRPSRKGRQRTKVTGLEARPSRCAVTEF
ncbi:hypothetical protein B0H14DRAFT_1202968 [Mycena olivaceomarginata]|nr:hypothetical protein B0H14DRAFT_1202968 [Mycena olivaceomarginata]